MRRRTGILAAAALLAACAHAPPAGLHFSQPVVLLGEVHDNAAQHALRLRAFEDWLARGARPALVMEQFDRDRQPAIDRLRAQRPPPDADTLIAAAGGTGWQWSHYRPFVALALRYELPIVAANVSRDDGRTVMRAGLQANGFDAAIPPDVLDAQANAIEASHCGALDAPSARRMALVQVARDQAMAAAVEAHAGRGVLLLAGNGHVRVDVGVPRWLSPATRARSEAIGLIEAGTSEPGGFDRVVVTEAQARPDPCGSMRR
jgi:uncharacterized iron-regulated protein